MPKNEMSDLRYLDLAVSEVQDNVDLANMADPKYLDLTISQVWGNECLTNNMSGPRYFDLAVNHARPLHLDLTVSEVQDNMSLANIPDPRYLNLTSNHVQGNDHLQFPWHFQRNNHPPLNMLLGMIIFSWHGEWGNVSLANMSDPWNLDLISTSKTTWV